MLRFDRPGPPEMPMPRRLAILLLLSLAACESDLSVTEKASCDGALQADEEVVDGPFDSDGDGYFDIGNPDCQETYPLDQLDCDDRDPSVNPGSVEIGCNQVDDDCDENTADVADIDGDGFDSCADCVDTDPLINPVAIEAVCNGIDDDCDPYSADDIDVDGDGYGMCEECDDNNREISPGTVETLCDGLDNDCNPDTLDAGLDADLDGVDSCTDCDDSDPDRTPGAEEICDDGIDNNCDGETDLCGSDYSDIWTLATPATMNCASGLVNINVRTLVVEDYNPRIVISAGTQPGEMNGYFTGSTTFEVENSIAGTCTENYTFVGEFTSDTTLSGTLEVEFVDSLGLGFCFDCTGRSWSITASR